MSYAERTHVTPEASRAEIERTLARYGASAFSYGWDGDRSIVGFRAAGRMVRFEIPTPVASEFERTPKGRKRTPAQAREEANKEWKRRWRALALVVKAKLEAVASGVSSFEEEFLAAMVLPDGTRVVDFMAPQVAQAYETGEMPAMLPALGSGS